MANMSTTYVDRDEASAILKVSTRTIDRYVRKFRFKTRKDGRRVLIKRQDVDRVIQEHVGQYMDIKIDSAKTAAKEANIEIKDVKIESKTAYSPGRSPLKRGVSENMSA